MLKESRASAVCIVFDRDSSVAVPCKQNRCCTPPMPMPVHVVVWTQAVHGKFCGTVCSWAKANLEKMPQQVMGLAGSFYHKKSRPRNSKTLICCWAGTRVLLVSPGSGHPNSQLQASAMASPPEREVAALESCFRYLPADAVPAVVDCVLASSTSSSPSQLFHALLRSSPPSQVV